MEFLFIGGPWHGRMVELTSPPMVVQVPVPTSFLQRGQHPRSAFDTDNHTATYNRRRLGHAESGMRGHVRTVYVDATVGSDLDAEALLCTWLLAEFIKGGEAINDG